MTPLTEKSLRASFVTASLRERNAIVVPSDLADLRWDDLTFLGWRDRRAPQLGYVVVEIDGAPVGIIVREADAKTRTRPQCSWCEDVTLPNDVVFYTAKRAGAAGRNGNVIGTLACAGFECSANVRKPPPMAYLGFDVEAARERRIVALGDHVRVFVGLVRDGG